jgi:hypothetical protein
MTHRLGMRRPRRTNLPAAVRAPRPLESAPLLLRQICRLSAGAGVHYQGKGETVALERNKDQQRHWTWTAALRRCSIVVSKSLAMIERRVGIFAHLYVNKDAAPEMYRLPIQTGETLTLG